jgi:hypothetical protein
MTRLVCSVGRLLIAATFITVAADGSAQPPTICGQPFDGDLAALADRIRQLPKTTTSKNLSGLEGVWVLPTPRREYAPGGAYWRFTPPDHPAHPAVSCMRIVNTGGSRSSFETQFHCQAAKERCDQLAAELSELDQWARSYFEALQNSRKKGGRQH